MKVKTLGDAVKQVKSLLSTLGVSCWYVFLSETRYFHNNPTYDENSNVVPSLGDHYKLETFLTVSDPVESFILKENFLFVRLNNGN